MHCSVSVIIPCYRCADTIERAVDSIIKQTLPPKEILLIEDCSSDEGMTLTALYRLQQRHQDSIQLKVIPLEANGGPGNARNVGWREAQQPYLAFLDADDSWHPKKLEIQYRWMTLHPDVVLTGHLTVWIAPGGFFAEISAVQNACQIGKYALLISNRFPTRTVMLQRDIAYRFEPSKRYAEDYLLWLRIVLHGGKAWVLAAPLAYSYKADFGAEGLTGNLWKTEKGVLDTYKMIYTEGLISAITYFLLFPFSMFKFLRRLLIKFLQRF